MPGEHFYKELIEEIINEDYTPSGTDLRETILNSLKVAEEKPKAAKLVVDYKNILLDGIQVIGGASSTLAEIGAKLDENQTILESEKKGFLAFINELIRKITHAEPEEAVYDVEYFDTAKDVTVREKVRFYKFRDEMAKKARILSSFVRGPAYNKLSAMAEDQIVNYLEKNIKDVQSLHKTLNALDDYFKANVATHDRGRIKGIKPELSALKNTFIKANNRRHEYSAQKEEEEQMKRLGISPV
jgi:hypothetical protein